MKKILFSFLSFLCFLCYSQEKEIIVLDENTKQPISQAHLFYRDLNEGSISNEEGKANLLIKNSNLSLLHLNYNEKLILKNKITELDTIWLSQKKNLLEEVIVTNINIKKKLQYVLDNFSDLYVDYPTKKECSFKETFLFDGNYKRLFLSQILWWSKSSEHPFKKNYNKFAKLKLNEISYSKNIPLNLDNKKSKDEENNSGAIISKSLINFFYLNHAINSLLLPDIGEIYSSIEESDDNSITVSYSTDWKINEEGASNRNNGKIIFDKKTNAIISFSKNIEFKNRVSKEIGKETGKTAITDYKNNSFDYSFAQNNEGKWSLNFFNTTINLLFNYDKMPHTIKFSNSLYVLKESKSKRVNDDGLIDLNNPIYKSLPSQTVLNSNNILLTKKEKAFINN